MTRFGHNSAARLDRWYIGASAVGFAQPVGRPGSLGRDGHAAGAADADENLLRAAIRIKLAAISPHRAPPRRQLSADRALALQCVARALCAMAMNALPLIPPLEVPAPPPGAASPDRGVNAAKGIKKARDYLQKQILPRATSATPTTSPPIASRSRARSRSSSPARASRTWRPTTRA
jgi:hypothetical protein